VLEGAASVEIVIPDGPPEGEFGGATFVLLPAVQGATVSPTVAGPTEAAVVALEAGGLPAGLYAGTCADLLVGAGREPVAELNALRLPGGARVGTADGMPVATSFTVLSVPFDQVVDGTHVVAVFDAAEQDTVVACGAIGGALDEGGALSIGIEPQDGSGFVGIAYISNQEGGLASSVSVFVGQLNMAPVAVLDFYVMTNAFPFVVPAPGVLANDYDPDGDPLTMTAPSSSVWCEPLTATDGSFTYIVWQPVIFGGSAYANYMPLCYQLSDGSLTTMGVIQINFMGDPLAPNPAVDHYTCFAAWTPCGYTAAEGVLANDYAPGEELTAALYTQDSRFLGEGEVLLNPDGSFTFTPPPGVSPPIQYQFIYTVTDTSGRVVRQIANIYLE
jgi:hypothetical protein